MPMRLTDPHELQRLIEQNAPADQINGMPEYGIGPMNYAAWCADERNIALRIGDDLALFEYFSPGLYQGHVFFASRGKEALRNGKAIMGAMDGAAVYGETPLGDNYRAVHWFNRQMGFVPVREVERPWGRRMFYVRLIGDAALPISLL